MVSVPDASSAGTKEVWLGNYLCAVKPVEQKDKLYVLVNLAHSGLHNTVISNLTQGDIIKDTLERLYTSDSTIQK